MPSRPKPKPCIPRGTYRYSNEARAGWGLPPIPQSEFCKCPPKHLSRASDEYKAKHGE